MDKMDKMELKRRVGRGIEVIYIPKYISMSMHMYFL